jgi:hypothetical protein
MCHELRDELDVNKNLFLRLTFCLSLQKTESKYNPTAGHHVPRSLALPIEELPFRRLNGVYIVDHCIPGGE